MEAAEFLKSISIFAHLKNRDLKRIAKQVTYRSYKKADVIIKEGDTGTRLFIVAKGEVDIVRNLGENDYKHLSTLGPKSYFGEMALWDNLVRSASVVANKETEVICLDKFNFRKAIEKYPGLAIELLQMMNRRIRALDKLLVETSGHRLPRCVSCGNIQLPDGRWLSIEKYITDHSDSEVLEVCCTDCTAKRGCQTD